MTYIPGMRVEKHITTERKAHALNLDNQRYGTFAEIGAGQEVARHFFQAGGAAGTIAKTISAYDMKFSDEIYGKCSRYVSRDRLFTMLHHEYELLEQRLSEKRGADTCFFAFANTVAATSYRNKNNGNGWLGLRFQVRPGEPPNDIIVHANMLDRENVEQQEALGILGVNLVYGAIYLHDRHEHLVQSLLDNLGEGRIEVDVVKMLGPAFPGLDNRLLSLQLVRQGHTNAIMCSADGEVVQPSQILYRRAVLVERGSFRPVTNVNVDILERARARFLEDSEVNDAETVVLTELTIHNLRTRGSEDADSADFLARIDSLNSLGYPVLISNYPEYYRLATYFRRYTAAKIGIALGVNNLLEIFNERYYESLEGGILEGFGRLFKTTVRLYVYPMKRTMLRNYMTDRDASEIQAEEGNSSGQETISVENLRVAEQVKHLYLHLVRNRFIESLPAGDRAIADIDSRRILQSIQANDGSWEDAVPSRVAELIRERGLFGFPRR